MGSQNPKKLGFSEASEYRSLMDEIATPPWANKDPKLRTEVPRKYSEELFPYLKAQDTTLWFSLIPDFFSRTRRIVNSMAPWLPGAEREWVEEETVRTLLRKVHIVPSGKKFLGLLHTVAVLRTVDAIRRVGSESYVFLETIDFDEPTAFEFSKYEEVANRQTPLSLFEKAEKAWLCDEALERVGSPCREILLGVIVDEKPHREVAAESGKGVNSIGAWLNKCKKKFKEVYEELWNQRREKNV